MAEQPAQPVNDRQPESQPAAAIPLRASDLVELAEDLLLLAFRNAWPAVEHVDAHPAAASPAPDQHPASGGVAHCIGHQVEQDAFEQNEVAANPGAARHNAKGQLLFVSRICECRLD